MSFMRRFAILGLVLLLAVPCFSQTKARPKQAARIAGTRVSIIPPAGFRPSTQFPGYSEESLGASIFVTHFPAPFFEAISGIRSPALLSKRGMDLLSEEEVTIKGQKALLFLIKQNMRGIEYLKWILVLGNQQEAVLITAAFPKQVERELSGGMRASLLTVGWHTEKNISPTEGLNFSITERGGLRLARRIANMLLYTKGGIFPSKDIDDAFFIVGPSHSEVETRDAEEYAKARILKTAEVIDISIEQSTEVTIDNLNGYEILAKAKDKASGQPMMVYQVMLFEEPHYFLMQGLVSNKNRDSALTTFKEMAATFRRKKS